MRNMHLEKFDEKGIPLTNELKINQKNVMTNNTQNKLLYYIFLGQKIKCSLLFFILSSFVIHT